MEESSIEQEKFVVYVNNAVPMENSIIVILNLRNEGISYVFFQKFRETKIGSVSLEITTEPVVFDFHFITANMRAHRVIYLRRRGSGRLHSYTFQTIL